MTPQPAQQMRLLATTLEAECNDVTTDVVKVDSGGAMLDVRRADGRLFTMAYGPSVGFGVDEVHEDEGWQTHYSFTSDCFESAAAHLRELVVTDNSAADPTVDLCLVVIYARDIAASRSFYDQLGLRFQEEQHGTGPRHFAATLASTVLEIYPRQDGQEPGRVRLGFNVRSVDRLVDRLRSSGTRILSTPKASSWGRRAVVEDPDGNRVELMEPLPRSIEAGVAAAAGA